jgi:hypothetical protein
MIEAEKRARYGRHTARVVVAMTFLPWLVLKAFKLEDGAISASDFLWYAVIVVPTLFLVICAPWFEDRRLRRLKQELQERRRPFLHLES